MPTSFDKIQELIEFDQGITEASQGTPLATSLPAGVNLADWTVTFEDDFSNISATISNNNGAGPWFANGTYSTVGAGTHATLSNPSNPIYTQESEGLGMAVRRDAGVAYWSSNITTAVYGSNLLNEPNVSFAQQYGYFECRMKPADPTANGGANALLWPAFWLYSLSSLGGSIGNMGWKQIELDIVELYTSNLSGGTTGNDLGHHFAVHFHEPRKWTAPDVWGRDVNTSNYQGMTNNATWGTDASFRFWNDFHDYGMLMSPEWLIFYFDGLEIGRLPMLEEVHQKYYLLVSNQLSGVATGGMPDGVPFKMIVDYVRVWQNPDWHSTSGGVLTRGPIASSGTANAKTFTSALPLTGYPSGNGRTFVLSTTTANTGPATASANGLGARPIFKTVETLQGSTLEPLTGGEILANSWFALRLDLSLNGGLGGWHLVNPGYSLKVPATYVPPTLTPPATTIDVEAIEGGLAEKHGIPGTAFPIGHPARTLMVTETDVPPRMPVSDVRIVADNITGGDPIGQVAVLNTPSRPVRYALTSTDGSPSAHFDVNPATGAYSVRSGVTTVPRGVHELTLAAWPEVPQAIIPGTNATHVRIDVREDIEFDFSLFQETKNLQLLLDAQDANRLTLDGTAVAKWDDGSRFGRDASQSDTTKRPIFNATGFAGLPAVVSAGGTNVLTLPEVPLSTSWLSNIVTRTGGVMSANIHGTTRMSASFPNTDAHLGAVIWSPGACTFWVNGVDIGLSGGGTSGITSTGAVFWALDGADAGEGNLGFLFDGARLFNNSAGSGTLHSALGEFAVIDRALDTALIDKCFGYLAHHWGLTSLLPTGHPYKVNVPRAWR